MGWWKSKAARQPEAPLDPARTKALIAACFSAAREVAEAYGVERMKSPAMEISDQRLAEITAAATLRFVPLLAEIPLAQQHLASATIIHGFLHAVLTFTIVGCKVLAAPAEPPRPTIPPPRGTC